MESLCDVRAKPPVSQETLGCAQCRGRYLEALLRKRAELPPPLVHPRAVAKGRTVRKGDSRLGRWCHHRVQERLRSPRPRRSALTREGNPKRGGSGLFSSAATSRQRTAYRLHRIDGLAPQPG